MDGLKTSFLFYVDIISKLESWVKHNSHKKPNLLLAIANEWQVELVGGIFSV